MCRSSGLHAPRFNWRHQQLAARFSRLSTQAPVHRWIWRGAWNTAGTEWPLTSSFLINQNIFFHRGKNVKGGAAGRILAPIRTASRMNWRGDDFAGHFNPLLHSYSIAYVTGSGIWRLPEEGRGHGSW